jgi:flagellar basal body rod protein FlgG
MASGMPVAVSGMRAEQAQFDVAANNIANADTPGYNSEQVLQTALPGGGVETTGVGALPGIPSTDPQISNVDVPQEMAGMTVASTLYGADAKVVDVQSRMDQSLFDTLA